MSKCVFNKANPNLDLLNSLEELCEEVWDIEENREKKTQLINGLQEIGEGYSETSLVSLGDYIAEYVKGNYPDLSDIVPTNIDVYLSGKSSNIEEIIQEPESKASSLEALEVISEKDIPKRDFISRAYGTATEVRFNMEMGLKASIVDAFVVNRSKGIVISDTATLNSEVRAYQETLLHNIVDFLYSKYSEITSDRYNVQDALDQLENMTMYKDGEYTDALSMVNRLAHPFLSIEKLTPDILNNYYNDAIMGMTSAKKFLNAYNSYVILNNFDAVLRSQLGKVLDIKPNTFGKFTADDKYSINNSSSNMPTTWRTIEDIDASNEINDITRLLVETTPMYLWQSSTPLFNRTLGLQEFNYMVSKIKDLSNNPYTKEYRFDGTFFNNHPEFNKYRNYLYGNTMYQLIAKIRNNPMRTLPIVYELLSNPGVFYENSSTMLAGFYKADMDLMYSLYKGMFEDSPNSLFGIMRRNPGKTNYFGYVTQTIDSVSSIKYAQYYVDENGNMAMRTLKDSQTNDVKRYVENRINGMLSKVAPVRFNEFMSKYDASMENGLFQFSIPNASMRIKFDPKAKRGKAFEIQRVAEDGTLSTISFFDGKSDWNNLLSFFRDFLKLDFSPGSPYMANYLSVKSSGGNIQYDSAIKDLLQFSTSVFFNSYASHDLVDQSMGWVRYNAELEGIYGMENKPQVSRNAGELNLVSKAYIPVLNDLALADSMTTGVFASSVVSDGEGNKLGSTTITRLFTNPQTQWVTQCQLGPRSATKGFSLLNDHKVLKDVVVSREFSSTNGSKQHSSFNPSESYYSSLVLDYVGGLIDRGEGSSRNGEAGFMPSVNSDKATILKMLISLNEMSQARKLYSQLTKEEVRSLINSEIGTAYGNIMDNVLADFQTLNTFALSKGMVVPLNPLTNFAEFNTAHGDNAAEVLNSLILAYLEENGKGSLELIDQVHYINNKGGLSFNRSLVSLTNRFNPNYFLSRGFDPSSVFGKLTPANEFWDIKERELLADMLDSNFTIETADSTGRPISTPEVQYLAKMTEWVSPTTKRVILAKFTPEGKGRINISKWSDLSQLSYTDVDQFGKEVQIRYGDDRFDISKLKGKLELHPVIANHNALDYLFTQEYMMTTVGSHIAHPAKKAASDTSDLVEEAARYKAQDKRNVSFTASMHTFQQGILSGIPSIYNMAVIEDLGDAVFNIMGDFDGSGAKVYDGATFVNPFIVYLENNSLGGSRAGIDKKQFIHSYKENTATGVIVKTAGFGITNDRIRNSKFYDRMMRKMTNHIWLDSKGMPFIPDITVNYRGGKIRYSDMYYKTSNGVLLMINSIQSNGDGTYNISESEVDNEGQIVGLTRVRMNVPINSNYTLWQAFGGSRSMELKDGELVPSEVSVKNVVKAMNEIGEVLNPNGVETQDDIFQALKHSDIHYVATAGAVKQGAANINSAALYNNDAKYTTMRIKMDYAGIQLNAEHSADEANLSIMTQVISSLASRGYTAGMAQEVYEALNGLTEYGIRDYLDSFAEYLKTSNPESFQNVLTRTITKALMNPSNRDSNMVHAVAKELIRKAEEGQELTFKDTEGVIPYSDPSVFNQLASIITSVLNKSAIRVKFAGTLSVLNPSHGIWKLYADRKLESFNNDEEIANLQAEYDSRPLTSVSQVKLGRTYNVTIDGVTTVRSVMTPQDYWSLKGLVGATITENITSGRDLATYDIHFLGAKEGSYNMWDLDVVKAMYAFRSGVEAIKDADTPEKRVKALSGMHEWLKVNNLSSDMKLAYKQLQASMQRTLSAIGSGDTDVVTIDDQKVQIDKNSVVVTPYECILPKIYASKFGLREYDDLYTIKNDPQFFLKRMLANWGSKVDDADFDIELKRLNGKHTYLINKDTFNNSDTLSPAEINKIWDGDKVYRVDANGQRMYRLSSDKDTVYTDANGNEIIVTDALGFYVGSNSYHTIRISDSATQSKHFNKIVQPVLEAQSKVAQGFSKYISSGNMVQNVLWANHAYKTSIDSIRKNPDKVVDDPMIEMLRDSAKEIHTSFMKSLDVLAARIPSQTMQSFMPMRVAAFENPDINSAYVNYWQIWLQGSDFDIDKVSMLGYSFDRSGKYIGWSPYFNLSSSTMLKVSETLPFPSGKKMEIVRTNDASLTNWGNDYVGSGKLFNFNGSEVIFLPEYDENGELGGLKAFSQFLRDIRANDNKLYVPANSSLPFDKIAEYVDNHNMYLGSLKGDASMDMIRNFISTYMYNISLDPVNLVQSQSPIDKATEGIRKIGDTSASGQKVKKMTPGNTFNKHISLFENMAGKEVIGISAAGMKIFFALTQYYNSTLNSGNPSKQSHLLFNKQIGGEDVRMLANSWIANPETVTNEAVMEALASVDNYNDAALILSAILSLATDNAKELQLAKINAGADMVGMYLYGISVGIDFKTVASIMMSKTARIINRVKTGNVFNNDGGIVFLNGVFDYIEKGVDTAGLDPEFMGEIGAILNRDGKYEKMDNFIIRQALTRAINAVADGDFMMDKKLALVSEIKEAANRLTNEASRVSSFKFIEKIEEYISNMLTINTEVVKGANGQVFSPYSSIKTLYFGGSEMRRLGSILGLNQGLKTKVYDKLSFIRSFEDVFSSRFSEFDRDEAIRTTQLSEPSVVNGVQTTIGGAFQMLADFVKADNTDADGNVSDAKKYRISFQKFVTNESYRNNIIEFYNGVKHTFNILDAVWTLPHFRGYLQTAFMDYVSQRTISSKFRAINNIGSRVIDFYGFKSSKDIQNVYKGVQAFLDNFMVNSWMKSAGKVVEVQKGVEVYTQSGSSFITEGKTPILLGTEWGNATFKSWMESTVLPDLKEGRLGENSRIPMTNKFIKDLSPIRIDKTPTKKPTFIYTLPISMIPKSDSEKVAYTVYKSEFNKLQSLRYYGYPISDLFFYYNLITFRNATTQNSLTSMFEQMLEDGTSPLLNEYKNYISMFDTKSDAIEGVDYMIDDVIMWCAPTMDTNKAKSPFVYSYDYATMTNKLYRRRMKGESTYDEDFGDDIYGDVYGDAWYDDDMGDWNESGPSYLDPSPDYEVMEDSRDSRYFLTRESLPTNRNVLRISATTVISLDGTSLNEVKYGGKTYTRQEVLKRVKELGGNESDLEIPYVVKRIGGNNVQVVDNETYSSIIDHIFDNPC